MEQAIIKIFPIITLLILGKVMEMKGWLKENTAKEVKSGIIHFALPPLLFLAFKNMELDVSFLLLSVIVFIMLGVFYLVGVLAERMLGTNRIIPFFVTAFAFGLMGIPLFEGVYGIENLSELSILGIGNEFFIWFIYFTMVNQKFAGEKFSIETVKSFLKSPMIIAIVFGLTFNLLSVDKNFDGIVIYEGFMKSFSMIASVTTPLILVIIGSGIRLNREYVVKATGLVILRLLVILSVGYLVKATIVNSLYDTTAMFDRAYFTFLVLPPPFALAIFTHNHCSERENGIINNAIVISTLATVLLFIVMVLFT